NARRFERRFGAHPTGVKTTFSKGHRYPTIGTVVSRADEAEVGEVDEQLLKRAFCIEIEPGRYARDEVVHCFQVLAPSELRAVGSQEYDGVARLLKAPADHVLGALEDTDDPDHGGGVDGASVGLVVEADVAAGDGNAERAARSAEPGDGSGELPHDRRPFRVTEIQAIGGSEWTRAGARHIARGFSDREHRS